MEAPVPQRIFPARLDPMVWSHWGVSTGPVELIHNRKDGQNVRGTWGSVVVCVYCYHFEPASGQFGACQVPASASASCICILCGERGSPGRARAASSTRPCSLSLSPPSLAETTSCRVWILGRRFEPRCKFIIEIAACEGSRVLGAPSFPKKHPMRPGCCPRHASVGRSQTFPILAVPWCVASVDHPIRLLAPDVLSTTQASVYQGRG